ncbi:MAG: fatty acid desaturase, partial [Deltaproteobacteria bacterium]|nr:fatty acid desaturase [Deltaproteobacteria bacterium]
MSFNPVLMVAKGGKPDWYSLTDPYARARNVAALWQLAANVIPYLLLLG